MMKKVICAGIAGFLTCTSVFAEDRALIMGLGNYQNPKYNLIGIDHDVKTMEDTAKLMGFTSVKVLQDEQVTKKNVSQVIQSWLVDGLAPQDRVLIYFSGHGSVIRDTNGDEDDGIDEVLTTYNVNVVNKKTGNSLDGVIVDDDFQQLLSKIPSNNILVLLDSCHSGTATRSLNSTMMSKALLYEGMPKPKKTRSLSKKPSAPKSNIVTMGAANDNEESLSVASGGLFTTGFNQTLREAIAQKKSLTPVEIRKKVDEYIQKRVNTAEYKTFHPQVNGSEKLINTPFVLAGADNKVTTNSVSVPLSSAQQATARGDLLDLISNAQPLSIATNQKTFSDGQNLTIQINSTQTGYLNIITVDPNNIATLLFPNQKQPDNNILAGDFVFPSAESGFNLTMQAPFGKSLIIAIFSEEKLNLYQNTTDFLKTLSRDDIKKISRSAVTAAGKIEIISCQSEVNCQ